MKHDEHAMQVAFFRLIDTDARTKHLPIFAVPNAARRSPRQGAWMKAEGMRAGVPDVLVCVPRKNTVDPRWICTGCGEKFTEHMAAGDHKCVQGQTPSFGHPVAALMAAIDGTIHEMFSGLALELKTPIGTLTAAQKAWHALLNRHGWRVAVCRSTQDAWRVLCDYLGVDPT